jgi:hypothetical protein
MAVHTKRGPQPVRTAGRLGVSGRYPVCAGSLRLIGVTLIGEALTGRSVVFVLLDHRGFSGTATGPAYYGYQSGAFLTGGKTIPGSTAGVLASGATFS